MASTKRTPAEKAARDAERAARYPSTTKTPAAKAGPMDAIKAALTGKGAGTIMKPVAKKTTAKPAPKPEKAAAPKKPVQESKPGKPTAEALVKFVARTVKPGATIHVLSITDRPSVGAKLTAHTHAALTMLGMLDASRPGAAMSTVLTMLGQRAVSYHKSEGNLEDGPDRTVRLTISGRNNFVNRKVNAALANDYLSMFIDGKVSPALGHDARALFTTRA